MRRAHAHSGQSAGCDFVSPGHGELERCSCRGSHYKVAVDDFHGTIGFERFAGAVNARLVGNMSECQRRGGVKRAPLARVMQRYQFKVSHAPILPRRRHGQADINTPWRATSFAAMTVLVTGGAGYIGSHTVRALRAAGRQVVVLDSLELGHAAAVIDAPIVVGKITDSVLIAKIVAEYGVTACIHFAAYKSSAESMTEPEKYFRNNTAGSFELIDALRVNGVNQFVFSSTAATYGTPDMVPVSESNPTGPESPYGLSKLMVEQILGWFSQSHNFRSVSLRYFNAAGAAMDGEIGEDWTVTLNLVPVVMKSMLERRPPLEVFGTDYPTPDGTAIRDYIHVDDLAEAHVKALEYLEANGETTVINLGTGTGSSVQEVIDMAEKVSGVRVPRSYSPRRAGDPVSVYADNTKARQVLGWHPQFGLEEIMESAWRWHSQHLDGFADA